MCVCKLHELVSTDDEAEIGRVVFPEEIWTRFGGGSNKFDGVATYSRPACTCEYDARYRAAAAVTSVKYLRKIEIRD